MAIAWNIRNIYLYLVAFVTLMLMLFGIAQMIDGLVGVLYPPPEYGPPILSKPPQEIDVTPEEWQKRVEQERENEMKRQRYYEIKKVVRNGAMILVALPVYLYHWRKIQKESHQAK